MEALITTEIEAALIREQERETTRDWYRFKYPDLTERERAITEQLSQDILKIFHDVNREFVRINLGLVDGDS